ncbi:MAG: hypothetical protein LBL81_05440, partial [Tannerella sp.]|nr:hypothetical protein [Tannerella sp.]
AELYFRTPRRYPLLASAGTLKLLYDRNRSAELRLIYNRSDTLKRALPPTEELQQCTLTAEGVASGRLRFTHAQGLRLWGMALEDTTGVVVDNYSLRGNSGLTLDNLTPSVCRSICKWRPYDLIILQYGLNVVSDGVLNYNSYAAHMEAIVNRMKANFPQTDFLLLGVSDRGDHDNGKIVTMPAILALLQAQRRIARHTQIAFWNTFGAMGGENAIAGYVEKGWAGKDYTHLTAAGGRQVASLLMNALMLEKQFYDELDSSY